MRDAVAAIERLNPRLNAVISWWAEPGDGMPILIKDCIDIAGRTTTFGAASAAHGRADEDAFVVKRLRAAGYRPIGKASLSEYCFGATGENPHVGDCRNPWDVDRIAGGSSSGSAAAVASGMVRAAIGTDTGGSIRIPAALCGVIGLRPTFGRVSNRGVLDVSLLCDTVGPIAATVAEAAALYTAMQGFDADDPVSVRFADNGAVDLSRGVAGVRVGIPRAFFYDDIDPDIAVALAATADALAASGATLIDIDLADPAGLADHRAYQFVLADVADARRRELAEAPDTLGTEVRRRLEFGARIAGIDYARCVRALWRWKGELRAIFADRADVLLAPATPITAPRWDESRDMVAMTRRLARCCYDVGAAGVPALTVPCGLDRRRLPIGAQVIGDWGSESLLFACAAVIERALPLGAAPAVHSNNGGYDPNDPVMAPRGSPVRNG